MATGSPCACCCAPADRPITSTPPVVDVLLLLHACQCNCRHTVSDVPPKEKRASEDGCGLRAAIAAQPITHFVLRKQVIREIDAGGWHRGRTHSIHCQKYSGHDPSPQVLHRKCGFGPDTNKKNAPVCTGATMRQGLGAIPVIRCATCACRSDGSSVSRQQSLPPTPRFIRKHRLRRYCNGRRRQSPLGS